MSLGSTGVAGADDLTAMGLTDVISLASCARVGAARNTRRSPARGRRRNIATSRVPNAANIVQHFLGLAVGEPVKGAKPGGFCRIGVNENYHGNRSSPVAVSLVAGHQGGDKADGSYRRPDQSYLNRGFLECFYESGHTREAGDVLEPHRLKLRPSPDDGPQTKDQNDDSHRDIERWIRFLDEISV